MSEHRQCRMLSGDGQCTGSFNHVALGEPHTWPPDPRIPYSHSMNVLAALREKGGTLPELSDRLGLPTKVVLATIRHMRYRSDLPWINEYVDPTQQTVYYIGEVPA